MIIATFPKGLQMYHVQPEDLHQSFGRRKAEEPKAKKSGGGLGRLGALKFPLAVTTAALITFGGASVYLSHGDEPKDFNAGVVQALDATTAKLNSYKNRIVAISETCNVSFAPHSDGFRGCFDEALARDPAVQYTYNRFKSVMAAAGDIAEEITGEVPAKYTAQVEATIFAKCKTVEHLADDSPEMKACTEGGHVYDLKPRALMEWFALPL